MRPTARDALLSTKQGHGITPVTDATGTTPRPSPSRFDVAAINEWNADQERARAAYRADIAKPRCGRCSWPETPTHACKT